MAMAHGIGWLLIAVVAATAAFTSALAKPQVPCLFIFGDSLIDNGNNNNLRSMAKANYFPYGIDFPAGHTGRFSNGKTAVDIITELLGFDHYISPYASVTGEGVLKGVNYASAAAGIRPETGQQLGGRIDFNGQVNNFKNTVAQMVNLLGGNSSATKYLRKCIFFVGVGSNDYINNYFQPLFYSTGSKYSPESYAGDLFFMQKLQKLGARKFAIADVGPVGCTPNMLAQNSPDGATFVEGFKVANNGCCGLGRNRGQLTCQPLQLPCRNRNEYLFWDAFHPTEAANAVIARRSYKAEKATDAYPVDIRTLAKL